MNVTEKSFSPTASTDAASPEQLLAAMALPGADIAALAQQFKLALAGKPPTEQPTNAPSVFAPRDSASPGKCGTEPAASPLAAPPRSDARLGADIASVSAFITPGVHNTAAHSETPASAIQARAEATASLEDNATAAHRNATDSESDTLGAAVLQSLLSQSSSAAMPVASVSTSPTSTSIRVQSLESVVAETVSRVLVSDPLHDGRREVRIEFARDVLPDTEVRLWRHEGRLHVEFISSPAAAENGLSEALPRLGDAIQQRQHETTAPVVTLRMHGSDAGSHPGDGRSRQQYRTPEELEETA